MSPGNPRVYLVDASIYIFRAWFSVPGSLTNSAGEPINAVHGFAGFLAGFLAEARPTHAAVVFDESLTTSFRNVLYQDYKANLPWYAVPPSAASGHPETGADPRPCPGH